ncbi:MAG: GNAT family N-acetyltransferase [Actinobacteria bacterium]|nr:GNAT family N-acetyltransferase [Actinomycetota bacterium]
MPRKRGPGAVEWRAPGDGDLDAWAALLAEIEAVDGTGEVITTADLANELGLPSFDRERDARLAWSDGELPVAWGTALVLSGSRHHRIVLEGGVHPAWRGRGIGRSLLAWQVSRGTELAVALRPPLTTWLEGSAGEREAERAALFGRAGFSPERHYFEMRRDLAEPIPEPMVPSGLRLVAYSTELDEAVRRAHNEALADHWAATTTDAAEWSAFVTGHRGFRADRSFVVLDGREVVGYAIGAEHPDDWPALGFTEGWTEQLGVRRPWRGRGVARALLDASLGAFARAGRDHAALDVDAENPTGAVALYERAGYRRARCHVAWARPLPGRW